MYVGGHASYMVDAFPSDAAYRKRFENRASLSDDCSLGFRLMYSNAIQKEANDKDGGCTLHTFNKVKLQFTK